MAARECGLNCVTAWLAPLCPPGDAHRGPAAEQHHHLQMKYLVRSNAAHEPPLEK